jgi:hypothetical protein
MGGVETDVHHTVEERYRTARGGLPGRRLIPREGFLVQGKGIVAAAIAKFSDVEWVTRFGYPAQARFPDKRDTDHEREQGIKDQDCRSPPSL